MNPTAPINPDVIAALETLISGLLGQALWLVGPVVLLYFLKTLVDLWRTKKLAEVEKEEKQNNIVPQVAGLIEKQTNLVMDQNRTLNQILEHNAERHRMVMEAISEHHVKMTGEIQRMQAEFMNTMVKVQEKLEDHQHQESKLFEMFCVSARDSMRESSEALQLVKEALKKEVA